MAPMHAFEHACADILPQRPLFWLVKNLKFALRVAGSEACDFVELVTNFVRNSILSLSTPIDSFVR